MKIYLESEGRDITLNCDSSTEFEILLKGDVLLTLENTSTNRSITIWLRQDIIGNRTLTFSNQFIFQDIDDIKLTSNTYTILKFDIVNSKAYCTYNSNETMGGTEIFDSIKVGDVADTFGSSVWLKSADIHYEKDAVGSRELLVK